MCDALARALRVPLWLARPFWIRPSASFPSLDAYIDATRDALVKALRAYECEAEACEAALRTHRRAERQRQQCPPQRTTSAAAVIA